MSGAALPRVAVPCHGCVRCCVGDAVRILPHEDANQWQTEPHPSLPGARMLAHQPDGRCVYLGDTGCSIHDRAPQQCRDMDCRNIARHLSATQARKPAWPAFTRVAATCCGMSGP